MGRQRGLSCPHGLGARGWRDLGVRVRGGGSRKDYWVGQVLGETFEQCLNCSIINYDRTAAAAA